eukprot:scaffold7240_cov129-Isochrysis_galbana.AAC.3
MRPLLNGDVAAGGTEHYTRDRKACGLGHVDKAKASIGACRKRVAPRLPEQEQEQRYDARCGQPAWHAHVSGVGGAVRPTGKQRVAPSQAGGQLRRVFHIIIY